MKRKQRFCVAAAGLLAGLFPLGNAHGQRVSGYVQAQYQWGEPGATLKVGAPNENLSESFHRWGLRRARLRVREERGLFAGALEVDLSERGLAVKDAYLSMKDPWRGVCQLRAGVFTCPFGYELAYPTVSLESPERSMSCRTLFPEEKDVGIMLELRPAPGSPWRFLKLAGGWFAGNGIKEETDNRRDFIGRLSAEHDFGSRVRGMGGLSYYNGSVYQGTEDVYNASGLGFVLSQNPENRGRFSLREYIGLDAEWSVLFPAVGRSRVQVQYVFGRQPGGESESRSPNASALPGYDIYNRWFAGGYVLFVQDLGKLPLAAVLKYDYYDPNTKIAGNNIGLNHTGVGDVAFRQFGCGLLWQVGDGFRLQAYYEMNRNETSLRLEDYAGDLRDDVFTLRVQYVF
jgi:hypothetical protein